MLKKLNLFIVVVLLVLFSFILAYSQCISYTTTLTKGSYPNIKVTYTSVTKYVGIKVCEKTNEEVFCGYLFIDPNNYDNFNGDTFYFPKNAIECKLEFYCSDNPLDISNIDSATLDSSTGWLLLK